ncbi:9997_t:CDS:2, partial [Gigaspora margarita]
MSTAYSICLSTILLHNNRENVTVNKENLSNKDDNENFSSKFLSSSDNNNKDPED